MMHLPLFGADMAQAELLHLLYRISLINAPLSPPNIIKAKCHQTWL